MCRQRHVSIGCQKQSSTPADAKTKSRVSFSSSPPHEEAKTQSKDIVKARVDLPEGDDPEGPSDKEVALDALRESDSVDSELQRSLRLLTQLLQFLHKMIDG